jgi:hypothetical protein
MPKACRWSMPRQRNVCSSVFQILVYELSPRMPRTVIAWISSWAAKRAPAGNRRRTPLRHGAREILQHLHVPVMGEGHRVRAAAGGRRRAMGLGPSIPPMDLQHALGQVQARLLEMQRDALGPSGEARGGGGEPAEPAIGEAQPGDGHILGLHRADGWCPSSPERTPPVRSASAPGRSCGSPARSGRRRHRAHRCRARARRNRPVPATTARKSRQGPTRRACRPARARARPDDASRMRCWNTTPSGTPAASQIATTSSASARLRPTGFSRRIAFPACASGTIRDARASGGVRIRAMSTSPSAHIAERSSNTDRRGPGVPQQPPRMRAARSACLDITPARRTGMAASRIASTWVRATMPVPIIAIPRGLPPECMALASSSRTARAHARIVRSLPLRYSGGNRAERQDRADVIHACRAARCVLPGHRPGSTDGATDPRRAEIGHPFHVAAARHHRLSEAETGARFGASRTPVREAMTFLRDEGLIETIPSRGNFVTFLSESDIRSAQFIREALEVAAATASATQASRRRTTRALALRSLPSATRSRSAIPSPSTPPTTPFTPRSPGRRACRGSARW